MRNFGPTNNFLKNVRDLATRKGIVLIFDECTSGFRETFGGIFKKFEIEPDLAMFGKTLGNGYAITAVVGKKSVMDYAQKTFISSTFWTERIGPSAALKTLEVMERKKSWEVITNLGIKFRKEVQILAKKYNLSITFSAIPAVTSYKFNTKNALEYKTLISQEMLKKNILASTHFYACTEHTDSHFNLYFEALDEIFELISKCELDQLNIMDLLESPICHSGFKRLN